MHEHFFRKLSCLIRITGPITSYCQVHQQEEIMVVNPLFSIERVDTDHIDQLAIDIPADNILIPINRVNMETFVEILIRAEGAADAAATIIRSM